MQCKIPGCIIQKDGWGNMYAPFLTQPLWGGETGEDLGVSAVESMHT